MSLKSIGTSVFNRSRKYFIIMAVLDILLHQITNKSNPTMPPSLTQSALTLSSALQNKDLHFLHLTPPNELSKFGGKKFRDR